MQEREAEARQNADPTGKGHTTGFMTTFGQEGEQFIRSLPPPLQQKYRVRLAGYTRSYSLAGANFEHKARRGYEDGQLTIYQDQLLPAVTADPDSYDARYQELSERVNRTGMLPHEKALFLERAELNMMKARIDGLARLERNDEAQELGRVYGEKLKNLRTLAPRSDINAAKEAIAGIESGGRYDALGPVIAKTGDRAYGKYQVMGENVGPWTQRWLGRRLTPEEFLANPQAQDQVFEGQFGEYTRKYGPEGAARAWFAGEKGMNNPAARDPLGTTVASYARQFRSAYQREGGGAAAGPAAAPTTGAAAEGSPPDYPNRPLASGVNPDLMRVVDRAARDNPGLFGIPGEVEREGVVAGVRTPEQQREMVRRGWSQTEKSAHVSARALDLWPVNPKTGKLDADYEEGYGKIAAAMRKAAADEGVAVQWGGDWKGFVDRPHWQLAPVPEGSRGAASESGVRYAAAAPATMTDATMTDAVVADAGANVVPLPRPRPPDGPTTTEPPLQPPPVAPPGQRARAIPAGATPMEIYAIGAIDKAAIDRAKLENEARKAADAESKKQGEDMLKEAFTRADPNRPEGTPPLTREFVESARPYISPSEYKGLLSALAPPEPDKVADHPDAILDLAGKVDRADPDEFIKDASAYVRDGKLKTETFRTMVNQNRSARKDDMPKSPYKTGYEFIDKTLNPGLFSDPTANAIARAAQANALAEYDVWSRANPNAGYGPTMEEAQNIIRRTQIMPFSEIRLSLGRSRYFADKMPQQVTIDDVKKADAQLRQDILSGNLTPEQQAFEARRLNDWTHTIEGEERLKLQQLQRQPSGQRRQQP
jgi:hypothetical protein